MKNKIFKLAISSVILILGMVGLNNLGSKSVNAAVGETSISGQTRVVYRVNGKGYNVRLFDANGKIQPQALHDGTFWKLFAKKEINGEMMYRLGSDKQWIPARYTSGESSATAPTTPVGPETSVSGVTFVKYVTGYSVRLFNSVGKAQMQMVKHGNSYKIFATKVINGEEMYRIGSQNQWIPARYTQGLGKQLGVPYINQYAAGAPYGCEAAAALQALHFQHRLTDYDLKKFLKTMPIAADNNPYHGFAGTPYYTIKNVFQTIFPPAFTNWTSKFAPVENISNQGIAGIKKQINQGNPVVAWVTLNFSAPIYHQYFWGRGVDNLHVMTVDGYTQDSIHVVDPVKGGYWVQNAKFATANSHYGFLVTIK